LALQLLHPGQSCVASHGGHGDLEAGKQSAYMGFASRWLRLVRGWSKLPYPVR
jgi:hypothetical protein